MTAERSAGQDTTLPKSDREADVIEMSIAYNDATRGLPYCSAVGMRAALSTLESRGWSKTEWQPIETAPWDGPPVLLWKESTREHYVAARVRGANGPGWCTPDGFEIFRATHWKTAPSPPEGKG